MSTFDPAPREDRAAPPNSQFFASPGFGNAPAGPPGEISLADYPPGVFPPGYVPPRDPMVEFREHLTELTPHVYVTWVLLAINVLVFVAMVVSGVSFTDPKAPELIPWGANFGPRTLSGEWWRILTCTFVHIGIVHILMNMFCLGTAGPMIERMLGNAGFAILYLVAGLGGSLASLLWNPMTVSAGASGAIFGMFGALLALMLRQQGAIPGEALAQVRNSGLAFVGYNLIIGFTVPNIDNSAHIGGLVTGFLCGLVLSQPLMVESLDWRWLRNLLAVAAGTVLIGGGIVAVQSRWQLAEAQAALVSFDQVEQKSIGAVNAADLKALRGELKSDELVNLLDREVLPEWRAARARLAALRRLPLAMQQHVARVDGYAQLREEGWVLALEAIRENNPEKLKQGQAKQRLADDAAKAIAGGGK